MPVLTDPRQIVSPLPASLMKEVLDGLPSGLSAEKRTRTIETEPPTKSESRRLEAEDGARPSSSVSAFPPAEIRDKLYPEKRLVECWSLNQSVEHYGELEPMLHETKELIKQEVLEWAKLDREAYVRASEL
jgi:hypothetical protein